MEGENGLFAPQYGLILCLLPLVSSAYAIIVRFNQCFLRFSAKNFVGEYIHRAPGGNGQGIRWTLHQKLKGGSITLSELQKRLVLGVKNDLFGRVLCNADFLISVWM